MVVHGDVAGLDSVKNALCDWLDWMAFVDAGSRSQLDRYIGYYEPYATSHDQLDGEGSLLEEIRNVARSVAATVRGLRSGRCPPPDRGLENPRPK